MVTPQTASANSPTFLTRINMRLQCNKLTDCCGTNPVLIHCLSLLCQKLTICLLGRLDFLDSCRANTLLAELDDEEDLPEPDDDDDENEDDNQEDQEYEEVLVMHPLLSFG